MTVATGLALAGCSSDPDLAIDRLTGRFTGAAEPDPAIVARLEALLAAGTPAIAVSVEERDQLAGVVRIAQNGPVSTWLSVDNVTLSLDEGMLTATRGMGFDLHSADVSASKALILGRRGGRANRFQSYLGGEHQVEIQVFVCEISNAGPTEVPFGAARLPATLMRESCSGRDREFFNLYWVADGSGEILLSRQWAGPDLGMLTLKRLAG